MLLRSTNEEDKHICRLNKKIMKHIIKQPSWGVLEGSHLCVLKVIMVILEGSSL